MSYQDTTFYALLGLLASVGLTQDDVNIQSVGPTGVWEAPQSARGSKRCDGGSSSRSSEARRRGRWWRVHNSQEAQPKGTCQSVRSSEGHCGISSHVLPLIEVS
jgi:hypothetical protein